MLVDKWGQVLAGSQASIDAWDRAWGNFVHFVGDPIADLAEANAHDNSFVMGPVFVAAYLVLGGTPLNNALVHQDRQRALDRSHRASQREQGHVHALEALCNGDFSEAADQWARLAAQQPDFAATRFAHDVYLHAGGAQASLAASLAATETWGDKAGASYLAGQLAFALEEVGRYADAESLGREALNADPADLWARHALAHVYESTSNSPALYALLEESEHPWPNQDGLATHVWWHLALRRLADGHIDAVLAIADERMPSATTAFRLCDQTSLLWRTELAGHSVGNRWDDVADRWAEIGNRHTSAFLDMHAAMAFARRPKHPGAAEWAQAAPVGTAGAVGSENVETMALVSRPLGRALRRYADGDPQAFLDSMVALGEHTHRVGGSVAQRDIIELTRQASQSQVAVEVE